MRRILQDNVNTKKYWNNVSNEFLITDEFRYTQIAYHIVNTDCKVVDIGCGDGSGAEVIKVARPDITIDGIDFIEKPKKIFNEYFCGSFAENKFKDGGYDYAISSETLEHLDEPQNLINEMFRLVRDGGRVILTTPLWGLVPSNEHVWEFDFKDLEEMFKIAGFSRYWVFPWASQRIFEDIKGNVLIPDGEWNTIFVLAEK